jgi:hypothetical protein
MSGGASVKELVAKSASFLNNLTKKKKATDVTAAMKYVIVRVPTQNKSCTVLSGKRERNALERKSIAEARQKIEMREGIESAAKVANVKTTERKKNK